MPQVAKVEKNILVSKGRESTLILGWLHEAMPEEDAAADVAATLSGQPNVTVGGAALAKLQFSNMVKHDLWRSELIALPLLIALGLWFFRSLIAALLPVSVGLFALFCTLGCLRLAAEVTPISIFCLSIASGLALGLAVDYSLLMVARFRDELSEGLGKYEATLAVVRTAGKTVAFSSAAIAGSFSCLFFIPVPFIRSIAVAGILVAFMAGIGALLILPAVFTLLGERVDALRLRVEGYSKRERRCSAGGEGWHRFAQCVIRKPVVIAVGTSLALVALGLPSLGMNLRAFDETALPVSSPLREFSEKLQEEFRYPMIGEIRIAIRGSESSMRRTARRVERVAQEGGMASPFPYRFKLSSQLHEMRLNPTRSLYSSEVEDLVVRLRRLGEPIAVGGSTAEYMDLKAALKGHLLTALAVLILLSFSFLLFATHSVVLPVKALLMNVLSLGAALGLLVVVFQEGHLEDLLGYSSQGALVIVLPAALAVGAFGLLTDYGLFLLMRIRETREKGHSDQEAIVIGMEKTGPIVTAAALLFCTAVGALITSEILLVKEVAFGIVVAMILDAFVIRPLLVPSLMVILGRWNWWPFGIKAIDRRTLPPGTFPTGPS